LFKAIIGESYFSIHRSVAIGYPLSMTAKSCLLPALIAFCLAVFIPARAQHIALHETRLHPSDLEIGGDLRNVPHGQTRFVTLDDLLTLPLESFTVSDDANFSAPVKVEGIALEKLPSLLGAATTAHMVTAICDDAYNAHYPVAYFKDHHPVLALLINGQRPDHWPIGADGVPMGPYLITHPSFKPAYKVLAHNDEPQVPWGIVRLDFRVEADVYAPIMPLHLGPTIVQGFSIASQNCFRCHASNGEGGTKSDKSWQSIAKVAASKPDFFNKLVVNPLSVDPTTAMAASPSYDAPTLAALRTYFTTFTEPAK
jgi:hypothetical protein